MGEYAEYELDRAMRRGTRDHRNPTTKSGRNPITAECPICGKGTRSLAGDENGGLEMHMRKVHPTQAPKGRGE